MARAYQNEKHLFTRCSEKSFADAKERAIESLKVIAQKRPFAIPPSETINILGGSESSLDATMTTETFNEEKVLEIIKEANGSKI